MALDVMTSQMHQALLRTMDVVMPDKYKNLLRRYKDQSYEHFFMLNTMNLKLPAANRVYSHYEDNYIIDNVTVLADTVAGAPGAAVTVTLEDAYYDAVTKEHYPRLYDTVLLEGPNGDVEAIIMDVDDSGANLEITIIPSDELLSIPALTAGNTIGFTGNTHSEGGGQPRGRQSQVIEITNKLKIIKETKEATGSSLTDRTWFDLYKTKAAFPLPSGETWGYYRKALMDLEHEMACWLSNTLLFGQIVTNPLAIDATNQNRPLHGTKGLFPETAERGHPYGYMPNTIAVADFDAWNFIYEQEYSFGTEVILYFATHLYDEVQNMLTDFGRYTDMTLVSASRKGVADSYFGGKEKWEMSVGFEYFNKSGRSYLLKKLTTMSNIKQWGAVGYSKLYSGLILPLLWDKDKLSGEEIPSVGYRYAKLGGYNREYEVWTDGAAGGQDMIKYSGEFDVIKHYVRSEIGAEQYAANRNILVSAI